jgi:hypothetical protein
MDLPRPAKALIDRAVRTINDVLDAAKPAEEQPEETPSEASAGPQTQLLSNQLLNLPLSGEAAFQVLLTHCFSDSSLLSKAHSALGAMLSVEAKNKRAEQYRRLLKSRKR